MSILEGVKLEYQFLLNTGVGVLAFLSIVVFLLQQSKGNNQIPWQLNAYIRIFVLVIFIYLLNMGIIVYTPALAEGKLKIFTDGAALSGDLVKTLLGAIIGAVSVSIAGDKTLQKEPLSQHLPTRETNVEQ